MGEQLDRLDALRAFIEVADRNSFTDAARRLGLSKAMVSKHVGQLETHAGARLLNRTTRRIALTEAGTRFLAEARLVVEAWDRTLATAAEDPDRPGGLLRIAAPKVFGETVVAPLLGRFLAERPELRVELACEERQVDVVGEGFDLAIRLGPLPDSGLIARPLGVYPYVFCAARAYLEHAGLPRDPREVAAHDGVINAPLAPEGVWRFQVAGETLRVAPRLRARVNSDGAARALVRAGLGIGLLMRKPVEADIAGGRLVSLFEGQHDAERRVSALIPHRTQMPAKTRVFVDYLGRALAGQTAPQASSFSQSNVMP